MRNRGDWKKIKAAYQKGEGSCRELAERFGVSAHTLQNKCKREKWRVEQAKLYQKVTEKVEEVLLDEATAWVKETIERGKKYREEIDASKEQMAPAVDPVGLDALSRVEVRITDMVRKAFGLSDAPQEHKHSGSIEVINPYASPKDES